VLTLALDTTTRAGSVAVATGDAVLAVAHGDASRTHGERLPAEIDRALHQAGVTARDLQLLTVASGPGAFTGLRIGLATMQGLAMVLGIPVIAVSALDALALAARRGGLPPAGDDASITHIAAWMDAQRGEVFAAFYRADDQQTPTPLAPPIVGTPEVVLAELPGGRAVFIGDGAVRYESQILRTTRAKFFQSSGVRPCKGADSAPAVMANPAELATFIAAIGIARALQGHAGPPHALQPLYVRRPDAELERQRQQPPRAVDVPSAAPESSGDDS
jgi:tRNA threonylcarbamoyladenosine biosynthesis protein TsaB